MGAFDKLPWVDPAVITQVSPWQELIERLHPPSSGDAMHLGSPPSDPLHKQGTGGWPGWAPSKLFERTGADQGRPREAKRTHPKRSLWTIPICELDLHVWYIDLLSSTFLLKFEFLRLIATSLDTISDWPFQPKISTSSSVSGWPVFNLLQM